jgi:two-component sensor histidine kinase
MAFYRNKLDYQRLLPEMSERLATQVVLEELAELLTQDIPTQLQIQWAYLAVLDAGEEYFVPVGDERGSRLPSRHEVVEYLQRTRNPISYLQPADDLPDPVKEFLTEHQDSALIIPLAVGGKLVGLYHLGLKHSGDAYTGDEVRLLHLLARQAAVAVENSRLFQQTERLFQAEREQRRLAEALQEAAATVNRTLELDQVLARILEQVERVVPGDAFNIMLIEDNVARAVRWRGYEQLGVEESISRQTLKIADYPTLAYMKDTGQPVVVSDTTQDSRWVCREGWEWLHSYVSAPIQVTGQTVGFLNVDRTRPTPSGLEDGRRLEALAHHAATALEHARLYEQAQQELGERKRAEEQLKTSLAEKEVLLQEIHHRVKNNLQVISSLLYLQSLGVDDPQLLTILQESRNRVRSMALVHEHLYQTDYPTHVDAAKYVRTLTNYLLRSYEVRADQIKLQIEVDDLRLGIDTAVPCGLLVNELVSNALKHAFPDGQRGTIRVALQAMTNKDHRLLVADDGIGLSGKLEERNGDSLGLRLVQTLTQQLEGVIDLDTSAGTRFEIVFPVSDKYKGG